MADELFETGVAIRGNAATSSPPEADHSEAHRTWWPAVSG
jgi:hypothetical protein